MDEMEEEKKRLTNEYQAFQKKQGFLEERINSTEERLGGVERQQNFVYKEINDISKYQHSMHDMLKICYKK